MPQAAQSQLLPSRPWSIWCRELETSHFPWIAKTMAFTLEGKHHLPWQCLISCQEMIAYSFETIFVSLSCQISTPNLYWMFFETWHDALSNRLVFTAHCRSWFKVILCGTSPWLGNLVKTVTPLKKLQLQRIRKFLGLQNAITYLDSHGRKKCVWNSGWLSHA